MCEECEELSTLREVYLARRSRMARTWTPRRPWIVEVAAPAPVMTMPTPTRDESISAE